MLSGIGLWQLLIVLAIVIMLFGTKRIRSLGSVSYTHLTLPTIWSV